MKLNLNDEVCILIKPYVKEVEVNVLAKNNIDITVDYTEAGEEALKENSEELLDLIIDTVDYILKQV